MKLRKRSLEKASPHCQRTNRRRTIVVSADLDKTTGDLEAINTDLVNVLLPMLEKPS